MKTSDEMVCVIWVCFSILKHIQIRFLAILTAFPFEFPVEFFQNSRDLQ